MQITEPVIYTTGAFLRPVKIAVDGKERWAWVVIEFEDDSFRDGDVYNPKEFGENKDELLINTTPEPRGEL